jgi:hypothetical protein
MQFPRRLGVTGRAPVGLLAPLGYEEAQGARLETSGVESSRFRTLPSERTLNEWMLVSFTWRNFPILTSTSRPLHLDLHVCLEGQNPAGRRAHGAQSRTSGLKRVSRVAHANGAIVLTIAASDTHDIGLNPIGEHAAQHERTPPSDEMSSSNQRG